MNITFLIGNGFDMGLGLKTGYRDFYQWLINNPEAEDNMIRKQIEQDESVGENNRWSDLEYALGQYTGNVDEVTYEKFANDKVQIDRLLLKYLREERAKVSFDDIDFKDTIVEALMEIRDWKAKKDRSLVASILSAYKSEEFLYQAINFNYTDCFDCLVEEVKKGGRVIGNHRVGNAVFNESIGEVLHIHGELDGREMILGVNDETQIKNQELLDSTDIRELLIKPELNSIIGQDKINDARKIIGESGIICLYGVSLGDTDKMWWEYIGKWLRDSSTHILIIFDYNPNCQEMLAFEEHRYKVKKKEHFLVKAGMNDLDMNIRRGMEERILIGINKNIFDFSEKFKSKDNVG